MIADVGMENKDYLYIFRIFSELNLSFNVRYIKLRKSCSGFVDNLLSDNAKFAWFLSTICQCYAKLARFLLPICYLVMYTGFANKTRTYYWHRWYRICHQSLSEFDANLATICYQFAYWIIKYNIKYIQKYNNIFFPNTQIHTKIQYFVPNVT